MPSTPSSMTRMLIREAGSWVPRSTHLDGVCTSASFISPCSSLTTTLDIVHTLLWCSFWSWPPGQPQEGAMWQIYEARRKGASLQCDAQWCACCCSGSEVDFSQNLCPQWSKSFLSSLSASMFLSDCISGSGSKGVPEKGVNNNWLRVCFFRGMLGSSRMPKVP